MKKIFYKLSSKYISNQKGFTPYSTLLVVAIMGVFLFILVSSVAPLKDELMNKLYPKQSSHASDHMKIALRVANAGILDALQPYRDGTKGNISFVYYGDLGTLKTAYTRGYTTGNNPVELSDTVSCDNDAPNKIISNLQTYKQYNVTGVLLDCEYGDDHFWGDPDLVSISSNIHSRLLAAGSDLKIQVSMQFGLLENKLKVTGSTCYSSPSTNASTKDCYICPDSRVASSCKISESYASQTWSSYDSSDILAVFGRSGSQDSVAGFIEENTAWINYAKTAFPNNSFWVVSGLWDKADRSGHTDGLVDLDPSILGDIAIQAETMGVKSLAIYWAGDTSSELFGPTTEMDIFLNKWASHIGVNPTPTSFLPTPTSILPSPTIGLSPTPTPSSTDTKSPAVQITSPNNGSLIKAGSKITIKADSKDDVGVGKVEFYLDNVLKCTDLTDAYNCSVTVSNTVGVTQTILVKAYDAASNNVSATETIKTKN